MNLWPFRWLVVKCFIPVDNLYDDSVLSCNKTFILIKIIYRLPLSEGSRGSLLYIYCNTVGDTVT